MKLFFVVSILAFLIFPKAAYAADLDANGKAVAQITVNPELHRPTTLILQGPVKIRTSEIGDVDGDGLPDVQTEIVAMNLAGTTPQGLAVNLNSSKSNRSMGMAELISAARGINSPNLLLKLPANSFFDVFTELTLGAQPPGGTTAALSFFDVFTTEQSFHLEGVAKSLTDPSGAYALRKNITVTLFRHGVAAGTLQLSAINLNSSKSN